MVIEHLYTVYVSAVMTSYYVLFNRPSVLTNLKKQTSFFHNSFDVYKSVQSTFQVCFIFFLFSKKGSHSNHLKSPLKWSTPLKPSVYASSSSRWWRLLHAGNSFWSIPSKQWHFQRWICPCMLPNCLHSVPVKFPKEWWWRVVRTFLWSEISAGRKPIKLGSSLLQQQVHMSASALFQAKGQWFSSPAPFESSKRGASAFGITY